MSGLLVAISFSRVYNATLESRGSANYSVNMVIVDQPLPAGRQVCFILGGHNKGGGIVHAILVKKHAIQFMLAFGDSFSKMQRREGRRRRPGRTVDDN